MTFFAFGVNHLRAPLEVREAFALDEKDQRALHRRLRLAGDAEVILLSTCNRTEAYLYGERVDVDEVRRVLCEEAGRVWPHELAFFEQDETAVRHVLEVAAGLKSLVLGDAQIFAQLKEAYRIAVEEERVDTTMHRLMHTAFRTAKRVINETELTTGAATVPYQAVEVAQAHFQTRTGQSLAELRAFVVGTGSMGRLAAEALKMGGVTDIAFTNRSEARGREIAGRYHGTFIDWGDRHEECLRRDVIVVATSAAEPVIIADGLKPMLGAGEKLFLDISVPRNVEPPVKDLDAIDVVDLDQLNHFLEDTEALRKTSVPDARRIVDEMLGEFVSWVFHHQALQPAIQAIADTFETIRTQEVNRHSHRFAELDREELDRITRSMIQKILAVPIVRLKSVEPESIDFAHGVRLLHALFRREECDEQTEPMPKSEPPSGAAHLESGVGRRHESETGGDTGGSREDCPIEPQLSSRRLIGGISDLDLDDALRRFSRDVDH